MLYMVQGINMRVLKVNPKNCGGRTGKQGEAFHSPSLSLSRPARGVRENERTKTSPRNLLRC